MKKNYLFGLLSLFTLLFAASCQEDELAGGQMGDTATVTFQVNTPMLATRAVGDGTAVGKSGKLYVAVYEKDGQGWSDALGASKITPENAFPFEYVEGVATATVPLDLAKNKDYSIVFWAETNENGDAYSIDWDEGGKLSLNTTNLKANQESYDAFWAQTNVNLTGAMTKTIELKRPFAQLNIGTSDKEAAKNAGIVVEQTKVTVKQIPTTLNFQVKENTDGHVGNYADVTYDWATIVDNAQTTDVKEGIEHEEFPADKPNQSYLALNYLLVNEKITVDVNFQYQDADDAPYELNFPSVPVQRNFRTNIYGTLLTNKANYTVEIKPGFGDDNEQDAGNIVYVTTQEDFEKALKRNDENIVINLMPTQQKAATRAAGNPNEFKIYVGAWTEKYYFGGVDTDSITINANGCTINFVHENGDWNYIRCVNDDAKWIINDAHLTNSGKNDGPWNRHDIRFYNAVELNNVTSDKAIAVLNDGKLTKVTISEEGDVYGLWITAEGQKVELYNCTFKTAGRGIAIKDEYVDNPALVELKVENTKFNTEKKAAILVTSTAGANISLKNVDLSGVKADGFNAVWVDDDRAQYADLVTVTGGFCVVEDATPTAENNPFLVENATVPVAKGVYSALPKVANGVTIVAEEGTVFTGTSSVSGKNVTIKNVTFKGEDKALTGDLYGTTFENCHFDATYGAQWCYAKEGEIVFTGCTFGSETSKRGVHFDSGEGSVRFESCTFYGFNALGSSLKKLTFNDCDIKVSSNALNGFNGVNMYGTTYEYNNCRFEPGTYTDCTKESAVVATYTNCSYTDKKSIYSLVRFDGDPAICTITFDGKQLTSTSAQLANAVAAMQGTEATFVLAKGTFALPTSLTDKTLVLEGVDKEATIIDMTHGGTPQYGAQSVTFKNLTMKRKAEWIGGFSHSQAEHYEDCIVEGTLVTYCPTVTATRTNFVPAATEYYNVHLYSPGTMTFTNCNFSTTRGRSIYAHHDDNASEYNITINGCTFTTGEMTADDSQNQAAIRLHTEAGIHGTLTINNSTATGWKADHNGGLWVEWNNSTKEYTNNFVKKINGVEVVNPDVYNAAQLQAAINAATTDGSVIKIGAGTYEGIINMKSNVTLMSADENQKAVLSCVNLNGADNITLKNIQFDAAGAKVAYDGKGNQRFYGNIISGDVSKKGKGTDGLVIDGCVFTGTFANGGTTIAFNDQGRGSGQSGNITIKNCTFETEGGYVDIYTYYSGDDNLIIENNTFNSTVVDKPIYLGRYQSSTPVVVKGNAFMKVADFAAAAYIQAHSSAYTVSFDESGNTFAQ